MDAPAHCHTCPFMQRMLVTLAGQRVIDLHCRQGVPDRLRETCQLHSPRSPPDQLVDGPTEREE